MTLGWCCRDCDVKDIRNPDNAPHSCGPSQPIPEIRIIIYAANPKEAERKKVEDYLRKQRIMNNLKPLQCDGCGQNTNVFVYENDLNGSYFYCDDCVEKDDEEL